MPYHQSAFMPLLFRHLYDGLMHFLRGLFDVRGRTGRLNFWLGMAFASLLTNAIQWLAVKVSNLMAMATPSEGQWTWAMLPVWLALTLPLIARRFNDMRLSPALALFAVVPPIASIIVDSLGIGFASSGNLRWYVDISNPGWMGLIMVLAAFYPLLAPGRPSPT